MAELRGGAERISLGFDYTLVAPGLRGRAQLLNAGGTNLRAAEESTGLLDDVLAKADMRSVKTVEIRAANVLGTAAGASQLRDANGDDALVLETPDLGPETGQLVMSVNEAGAITWHFAMEGGEIASPDTSASRGAGAPRRFYIRRDAPSVPPGLDTNDRALFGATGRKLLKVIVYPVTDRLLGKPARAIAEYWEEANRAYGLRRFTPADYRAPTSTDAERSAVALTTDDAQRLTRGRALLFLHGTFSTAHGAFHDIPPELMGELHRRYDGRVFAFNHFSLSHDPKQNVEQLLARLQQLLPSGSLDVDIVSHSRGGLVARTLAEGKDAFGIDTDRVRVHRIVFAGVPNQGTLLAKPDHMVSMIDRMTTALNLVPPGGVADILEGVLIGVKIIGHGALKALVGLRSMDPDGDFLQQLNKHGRNDAEYLAISANYAPSDAGLRGIVRGAVDSVMDRVFEANENDLVVPESGVYAKNGSLGFPIADARCVRIPESAGVMHTGMFGHGAATKALGEWLRA